MKKIELNASNVSDRIRVWIFLPLKLWMRHFHPNPMPYVPIGTFGNRGFDREVCLQVGLIPNIDLWLLRLCKELSVFDTRIVQRMTCSVFHSFMQLSIFPPRRSCLWSAEPTRMRYFRWLGPARWAPSLLTILLLGLFPFHLIFKFLSRCVRGRSMSG